MAAVTAIADSYDLMIKERLKKRTSRMKSGRALIKNH